MSARFAIAAVALASCSSSVQVVRQADPSPFTRDGCKVLYSLMESKEVPPEQSVAIQTGDLMTLNQTLGSTIGEGTHGALVPDANAFWIHTRVVAWDPGDSGGAAHGKFDVQLTDASERQVLDEFLVDASGKGADAGQRSEAVGRKLGKSVAKYIRHRVSCADFHSGD